MGLSGSSWIKICNYVFDCQSPQGLILRDKNFEDRIRSIKTEEGWGLAKQFYKQSVEVSVEKVNIKDAICESEVEEELTIDYTISNDSDDSVNSNWVRVYQRKVWIEKKSVCFKRNGLGSLNKRWNNSPFSGFSICSKAKGNRNRQKRTNSRSNRVSSVNISMAAFSNLIETREKLKRKAESLKCKKQFYSPVSTMSM